MHPPFIIVSNSTILYQKPIFNSFFVFVNSALIATVFSVIQSPFAFQEGSRFHSKLSGDVMTFLEQEKRWNTIVETHQQLIAKHPALDKMWESIIKELDISPDLSNDTHCVESMPLYLIDWYTTQFSISQGVALEEYKVADVNYNGKLLKPDCKKISSLIYSMFTFEHLPVCIQVYYYF